MTRKRKKKERKRLLPKNWVLLPKKEDVFSPNIGTLNIGGGGGGGGAAPPSHTPMFVDLPLMSEPLQPASQYWRGLFLPRHGWP